MALDQDDLFMLYSIVMARFGEALNNGLLETAAIYSDLASKLDYEIGAYNGYPTGV